MALNEPTRISKRRDTLEPVTGTARNDDGTPADLRGGTLRFIGRANVGGNDITIGEAETDGVCINVEDVDGPGSGTVLVNGATFPANRGRFRFEPTTIGVGTPGTYETELEMTKGGKTRTFPGRKADNPVWQIDEDLA